MRLRRRPTRWVHPSQHRIFKFQPSSPPVRGDIVMVEDERCRVLRACVKWDGREWRVTGRGFKVRAEPLGAWAHA